MWGDELQLPKPGLSDPDEAEGAEEEEGLTEEEEEEQARAEMGEVCSDCGVEFADANGSAALCQECFDTAESLGDKRHPPLSRYPVTNA
jgi:hypothetical protein